MRADIHRGDHVLVVARGNARAIDAGAIMRGRHSVGESVNVGVLRGAHASAFLEVEENHRIFRKSFFTRGGDSGGAILRAQLRGVATQRRGRSRVVQQKKSEARGFDCRALAGPSIETFARRKSQPVSSEREVFAQRGEFVVAGIDVSVEADISAGLSVENGRQKAKGKSQKAKIRTFVPSFCLLTFAFCLLPSAVPAPYPQSSLIG